MTTTHRRTITYGGALATAFRLTVDTKQAHVAILDKTGPIVITLERALEMETGGVAFTYINRVTGPKGRPVTVTVPVNKGKSK